MSTSPLLSWRLLVLSTVLALGAAMATYALLRDGGEPSPAPATVQLTPQDEVPSPDEATFTTFDGEEVPLSSLRGRPTVVNFFSSTCAPCVKEMPAFEAVHQRLGDRVVFLGLAVADRPEDAMALVERTGVTYRTAQDKDGSVMTAFGGPFLPTTVLLDADGEVVATKTGELDADALLALLATKLDITA